MCTWVTLCPDLWPHVGADRWADQSDQCSLCLHSDERCYILTSSLQRMWYWLWIGEKEDWRTDYSCWSLILIWSSTIFIFKIVLDQSVLTDDETEQQVLYSCKGEQRGRGHQPGDSTPSGPGTFANIYFEHLFWITSWNLTKTRTFEFVFLILKTLFFTCWDVFTLNLHFLQQEVTQWQRIKHWCIFFSTWDFVKTPKFVQFINICTSNH